MLRLRKYAIGANQIQSNKPIGRNPTQHCTAMHCIELQAHTAFCTTFAVLNRRSLQMRTPAPRTTLYSLRGVMLRCVMLRYVARALSFVALCYAVRRRIAANGARRAPASSSKAAPLSLSTIEWRPRCSAMNLQRNCRRLKVQANLRYFYSLTLIQTTTSAWPLPPHCH